MGKRGNEDLYALRKDSFAIKLNNEGHEYLELQYNEKTKKFQGDNNREMVKNPILLSQPNSPKCFVASLKLYLSKLTDVPDLFQQPNPYYRRPGDIWYKAQPVGEGTIGKFLATISVNAGLSYVYTNHCTRGTTATGLHCQGYSLQEISNVTKHNNLNS